MFFCYILILPNRSKGRCDHFLKFYYISKIPLIIENFKQICTQLFLLYIAIKALLQYFYKIKIPLTTFYSFSAKHWFTTSKRGPFSKAAATLSLSASCLFTKISL